MQGGGGLLEKQKCKNYKHEGGGGEGEQWWEVYEHERCHILYT